MECSIYALIACFSWSNLYIDTELTMLDRGIEQFIYNEASYVFYGGEFHLTGHGVHADRDARNPYGKLAIGYEINFDNMTIALEASHISSLANDDDLGVNGITLKARWFPFR